MKYMFLFGWNTHHSCVIYDQFLWRLRMLKYLYIFQDWIHYGWICYVDLLRPDIERINSVSSKPTLLDVGLTLNVHKTLREHLICLTSYWMSYVRLIHLLSPEDIDLKSCEESELKFYKSCWQKLSNKRTA